MEWTQRLRMRQLYLLVALYETRNVSHTATQMGVTQPGLSKWLSELEEDLNVKLFKRNSRGLTPTEFCTALVSHARAIIGELDRTQATIRLMSIGASGNLVVGTTPTVATGLVPKAAGYFRKRFPDAYLNIIENRLDALLPQLEEGRVDLVITRTDQARLDAGVRCDILHPEQIRVVVGANHPLAKKRKVDWPDASQWYTVGAATNDYSTGDPVKYKSYVERYIAAIAKDSALNQFQPPNVSSSSLGYDALMMVAETARKQGIDGTTPIAAARDKVRDGINGYKTFKGMNEITLTDKGDGSSRTGVLQVDPASSTWKFVKK
ncbi:transcriptional regulator, LysR family [Ostertagia ostertagi]